MCYMQISHSNARRLLLHVSKAHVVSYGDGVFSRVTCDAEVTGRCLQLAQQIFKTYSLIKVIQPNIFLKPEI